MGYVIVGAICLVAGGAIVFVYHAKIKKRWEDTQSKAQAEIDKLKEKLNK